MTYKPNSGLNRLGSLTERSLFRTGIRAEGFIKDIFRRERFDTGDAARSITTNKRGRNRVIVGSNRPQVVISEFGRKPGRFPNLDALAGWAARKGIVNGRVTAGYDVLESSQRGIVFLIARSISRRGIKPIEAFDRVKRTKERDLSIYFANQMRAGIG